MSLQKISMLKPNPQSDGVKREGLWEVIRLWVGLGSLLSMPEKAPIAPPAVWGLKEKSQEGSYPIMLAPHLLVWEIRCF